METAPVDEAKIEQVFKVFDINGDGQITTEELGTVLKGLGQEYNEDELNEMIASVDADGNGTISYDEFKKLITLQTKSMKAADELLQAFTVFDRDGSGYISTAELKFALKSLGEGISDSEIQEIILKADCDGDGQINYEEFARMLAFS